MAQPPTPRRWKQMLTHLTHSAPNTARPLPPSSSLSVPDVPTAAPAFAPRAQTARPGYAAHATRPAYAAAPADIPAYAPPLYAPPAYTPYAPLAPRPTTQANSSVGGTASRDPHLAAAARDRARQTAMAEAAQFAAVEAVLRSQLSDTTARLEHAQQAVLQRELAVQKLREHAQSLQEKLVEKDATLRRALKSIRHKEATVGELLKLQSRAQERCYEAEAVARGTGDDSRRSSLDSIDEDYPAAAREAGAAREAEAVARAAAARREAALQVKEAAL